MTTFHLVHLYPTELGINGDRGNVIALWARLASASHDVIVHDVGLGDTLPSDIDFVHVGSGPESSMPLVLDDARRHASRLRELVEGGLPLLAVSAGWHLLGETFADSGGDVYSGLGIFPSRAITTNQRWVSEVVIDVNGELLTGFENHSGYVELADGHNPWARVRAGFGNEGDLPATDRVEGVRHVNAIGTHLHGSLLPMNPHLADDFIQVMMTRRNASYTTAASMRQRDEFAAGSRAAICTRMNVRTQ